MKYNDIVDTNLNAPAKQLFVIAMVYAIKAAIVNPTRKLRVHGVNNLLWSLLCWATAGKDDTDADAFFYY